MSSRREETEASDTSFMSLLQSQTGSSLSLTSSTTTDQNVDTTARTMEEIWKDIFTENDLFYNDLLDSWSDSGDTQYNRRIRNRDSDSAIRAHNARMEESILLVIYISAFSELYIITFLAYIFLLSVLVSYRHTWITWRWKLVCWLNRTKGLGSWQLR